MEVKKTVSGGNYNIEWGKPIYNSDEIQDYWGVNQEGNVCKINIQLLYNANSKIVDNKPEILKLLEFNKKFEQSINFSEFLLSNKYFDNKLQILYKDSIIFIYDSCDNIADNLCFYELTNNVFAVFNKERQIRYLIVKKVSEFDYLDMRYNFNNIRDEKIKSEILNLYFRLYTYDQDNFSAIITLINDVSYFISNNSLDSEIINYFNSEINYLKEDIE